MNNYYTNKRLLPDTAIIVYRDKSEWGSQYFLEKRDIRLVGDKFTLMAPVPLSDDTLKEIAKSYMKTRTTGIGFGGMIAGHLLYCLNRPGKTVVIWYRPAQKRTLNFSASLKIKDAAQVQTPALLFAIQDKSLYVFALMEDNRPTPATKLYNGRFFNIYADGKVCLGSARVGSRTATYEGEAERFERAFFMAEQNGGQSEHNCKTPLPKLWNNQIKSGAAFPCKKELLQHKKFTTLKDLMVVLNGGQHTNEEVYDDED